MIELLLRSRVPILQHDGQVRRDDKLLGSAFNHNLMLTYTYKDQASGDLIGILTYTASVDPQTNTRSYSTNVSHVQVVEKDDNTDTALSQAYYDRVSRQPNIVCLTRAYVSRVVMSDSKEGVSRALGVEFTALVNSFLSLCAAK